MIRVSKPLPKNLAISGLAALLLGLMATPAEAATQTRISSWTYDAAGMIASETIEPDQAEFKLVTTYTYDAFGNKRFVTVSSGAAQGDPGYFAPRTTSTTYTADGRFPVRVTNALGQAIDPRQYEERTYHPAFGALTSQTGPNGLTTSWEYDSFGRKVLETQHGPSGPGTGTKTKWEYKWCSGYGVAPFITTCPGLARYAIVTTPLANDGTTQIGPKTTQYMDMLEREVRVETQGLDASGNASRAIYTDTEYDTLGRVAKKSRPYFASETIYWTTFQYDALGRVIKEILPDNAQTQIAYGANGNPLVTKVTNELGQIRVKELNSQGQTIRSTDDDGHDTLFTYDPFGNLSKVTDALGNQTIFSFDKRGRKTMMSDPDKGVWQYTYDALGQLKRQTDAKGQVTEIEYDLLGRTTSKISKNADATISQASSWVYDTAQYGVGKLAQTTAQDGSSNTIWQRNQLYDSLGRPQQTQTMIEGGGTQYHTVSYDSLVRPDTVSYPSGFAVYYTYTALSELKEVRKSADASLLWQANGRDAVRQLRQATLGNGVVSNLTYEPARGRLTNIQAAKDTNTLQNLSFQWDALGNLTQRADLVSGGYTENFAYDYLNRMIVATVDGLDALTMSYDAGGNILSKSDVGTYSYPASGPESVRPHAVSSVTGGPSGVPDKSYIYDNNGNMTSGDSRSIVWTAFDMPASISRGGQTLAFGYDAEYGRYKQASAVDTKHYYNDPITGAKAERTLSPLGAHVRWTDYVMVGAEMVAAIYTTDNGQQAATVQTRYFLKDHLGSIQTITDEAGVLVERLAYDPWGKRRFANGTPDVSNAILSLTDRGFTGHEHLEEVALIHMNGRVYDPVIGRFMSADPFIQDAYDSQAFNRYAYVKNNPLCYTDPSGYFFKGVRNFFKKNPIAAAIVGVATAWATGGFSLAGGFTFWGAVTAGATAGALTGGVKGAITGGVSGAVTAWIGGLDLGMGDYNFLGQAVMHGTAQGALSEVQGGSFGSAFIAASVTSAGMYGLGKALPGQALEKVLIRTVSGAVIGGTASVLAGGKFQNGAATGAFIALLQSTGPAEQELTVSKGTDTVIRENAGKYEGLLQNASSTNWTPGGVSVSNTFSETFVPDNLLPPSSKFILSGRQLLPDGSVSLPIPDGYITQLAYNGQGIVFRAPGTINNENIIRVGMPNNYTPYQYIRVYNSSAPGQPVSIFTGRTVSPSDSHYPFAGFMFSRR